MTHLAAVELAVLMLLLCCSAFFSGSEVALFSLDRKNLGNYFAGSPLLLRYLNFLLEFPRRLLVTILVGNTLVNIGASIIAVSLTLHLCDLYGFQHEFALTVQILVTTIVIVVFGEITPKVIASRNPVRFSKIIAFPLYWVNALLFPVSEFITEIIKAVFAKISISRRNVAISRDELSHLAELGAEKGTLEDTEQEIIQGLVSFKDVIVREIMRPRVDIAAVSTDASFEDVVNTIRGHGHRRIPLYRDSIDEIIGIIYAKDLIPFIRAKKLPADNGLEQIARKPLFVPATKQINDLMQEFRQKKMHIAIVVDEYGGTAGLVTLEDILEEIIGEIRDEYDIKEEPIQKISDSLYLIDGSVTITELNDLLGLEISPEEDEFETLGGLIFNQAGSIPAEGYYFTLGGYTFTVKVIRNRRVQSVQVEKIL